MKEERIKDIVCQVLVESKSKEVIYSVLNKFLPNYEKLNIDYTFKPDDEDYVFESEDEMISYFINTPNLDQTFYWNKNADNPDNVTVGANITNDDKLIIRLTFDGTSENEAKYYLKLKEFLNSKIGVISYFIPADYENGEDFARKYQHVKYEFE